MLTGGEIGIRTLVTLSRPTDFESGPFNHSGISPRGSIVRKVFGLVNFLLFFIEKNM
jgi:hypothetical protein